MLGVERRNTQRHAETAQAAMSSALDARSNPMIVGPQPVTAGLAELGCILLAQTSRIYVLTGPGAK